MMKIRHLIAFFAVLALFGGALLAQGVINPVPGRLVGQLAHPENTVPESKGTSPNLLEGRELFEPQGVALDTSVSPPIVYICDTRNNRVLGWRNSKDFANGAPADVVLGQRDLESSITWAPSASYFSGLFTPSSVAVDAQGNVFVMDSGNNRIVRYPRPFEQAEPEPEPDPEEGGDEEGPEPPVPVWRPAVKAVDLIIGQSSRTGRLANQSSVATAPPSATTLRTSATAIGTQLAGLAFDPAGHLWVVDSGNHRLLRYDKDMASGPSNITASGSVEPVIAANLVLGQDGFESAAANPGRAANRVDKRLIRFGGTLTFDGEGNLYFADDLARVLFYRAPLHNGKAAERILGLFVLPAGGTLPPLVNPITFGAAANASGVFVAGPRGLFTIDGHLYVVDTLFNRILRFDPPSAWPAEQVQISPEAKAVLGQSDFWRASPNHWYTWEPTSRTFNTPSGAVFADNEVWVADSLNHRVVVWPNPLRVESELEARGVLGQVGFEFRAPNFIQGREFTAGAMRLVTGSGLMSELALGPHAAIDTNSDPPRLYVADTGNNRILGFADARTVRGGDFAELVIGQVDFYRQLVNSPFNDTAFPTRTGLSLPAAVAVDAEGNLWVADTGNGRVLRYTRPFDDPEPRHREADMVIGQPGFESAPLPESTPNNLLRPVALAFTSHGQLLVADIAHNRVLRFDPPFSPGMAASLVLGQQDFQSSVAGNSQSQFALPMSLAIDADDRLYVGDASNNGRVQVFNRVSEQNQNGVSAETVRPSSGTMEPRGLAINTRTGELWVADPRNSLVRKFPNYLNLPDTIVSQNFTGYGPRTLALDGSGALYVVDAANRIAVHYPQGVTSNWASGFTRVAPGMIATLTAPGVNFSAEAAEASESPLPKELADLELRVSGVPAPLMRVQGDKIRYIVPHRTPFAGYVEFIVRRISTGEILAHQWQEMSPASPAFITAATPGGGQIRADNQDGTPNSASATAARGSDMNLYLVGYGMMDGPPEDGTAAQIPAPLDGRILVGQWEAQILDSTLHPTEPGVWRIRIRLPQEAAGTAQAGFAYPVGLVHRSVFHNRAPGSSSANFVTTIAIRP